jgi:preprotein translocase subunit SecG
MKTFFSIIHLLLCIMIMVVVLLQRRKQGGFGGAFGGAGTQAEFGQWQRFTGLSKLTIVLFGLFMLTAVFLSFVMA